MCNCKVESYNRSRYIPMAYPHHFKQWFPCGFCVDCINQKKSEYSLRSFYEAKNCLSRNGWILFDTLTYDNCNLKYFHDIYKPALYNSWDFKAFSRQDIKKFFKRLRVRLGREGYDVDGNLRYFLTSEYGTSEFYNGKRCTHRPHYHVLFFVNIPVLDPLYFSQVISECWSLGRTDGIPFKSKAYVMNNRVFRNLGEDLNKVTNYVVKYVTKDLYCYKKLFNRVYNCFTIHNPNWMFSYSRRLEFRRFKNQVMPFHLSSKGYGLSFIEDKNEIEFSIQSGLVRMPQRKKNGSVSVIALPMYFRRKLFQEYEWFNGKLRWKPNKLGYEMLWQRYNQNKVVLSSKLHAWNPSYSVQFCDDLAKYQLLYRGLYITKDLVDSSEKEIFDSLYSFDRYKTDFFYRNGSLLYCYSTEKYRYGSGCHVSDVYESDYLDKNPIRVCHSLSLREFTACPDKDHIIISSLTMGKRFPNFDLILDEYFNYNYFNSLIRSESQSKIDKLRCCYKDLGLL